MQFPLYLHIRFIVSTFAVNRILITKSVPHLSFSSTSDRSSIVDFSIKRCFQDKAIPLEDFLLNRINKVRSLKGILQDIASLNDGEFLKENSSSATAFRNIDGFKAMAFHREE